MAAPHPQLALDAQLCFPLYAASRAMTRAYAALLADEGLTYPQYLTLLTLWEAEGPMGVGAVGRRLLLDSGTLTPVLKRLETAGLLARRRDAADERRVLLEVTEAGWALRERLSDVPERLWAALDLSEAQARDLRDLLDTVVERLA